MKLRFNKTKATAAKWANKAPKSKRGVIGFVALTELLVLLPESILMMPMMILVYCYTLNEKGYAMGDASGLPSNFNWLLIGTAIVTLLFVICIQAWIVLAAKYAWRTPSRPPRGEENKE